MATLVFRKPLRLVDNPQSIIFQNPTTPVDIAFDVAGGRFHAIVGGSPLHLTLEVRDVDPGLEQVLLNGQRNEQTEALGRDVHRVILQLGARLRDLLRTTYAHYWIEEPNEIYADPDNYDNALISGEWLLAGNWHRRHLARREGARMIVRYHTAQPIDAAAWNRVRDFMAGGGEVPIYDVLMANAHQHASRANPRLAIVEGVMALDMFVKSRLADTILRVFGASWVKDLATALGALPAHPPSPAHPAGKPRQFANTLINLATKKSVPDLDEPRLRDVLDRTFITPTLDDLGRAVAPRVGLAMADLDGTLAGIQLRNEVVHDGRRDVPPLDTYRHLEAFGRVVAALR